jgi:hypothetical protein
MAVGYRKKQLEGEALQQKRDIESIQPDFGAAVERGDSNWIRVNEPTLKKYWTKDVIDLHKNTAEANSQAQQMKRLAATIHAIESATGGNAGQLAQQPAQDISALGNPVAPTNAAPANAMPTDQPVNEMNVTGQPTSTNIQPLPDIQNLVQMEQQKRQDLEYAQQTGGSLMARRQAEAAQAQPQVAQQPSAQPTPVRKYKNTFHIDDKGKLTTTLTEVDPETAKRDSTVLSVQNTIHNSLRSGQIPNLQDVIMQEQNRTGTALKSEDVENIAKGMYGASFESAMQELERMNRSGKVKMTDAQMYSAAAQHAARATGMRGIPQALQESFKPEVPQLPKTTEAQLFAETGQTPRTATPGGVSAAIGAQQLQQTRQTYENEAAQIRAQIANKPLSAEVTTKLDPLLSAERQTAHIFDIFSRKPYLVGKGLTNMQAAMQKAQTQLEGAPRDANWDYKNGALLNSMSAFIGKADPEAVELYKSIADLSDTILRARSGAQINEQEYRRLSNMLFSKWDEPATFQAGLDRVRRELKDSINTRIGLAVTPAQEIIKQRGGAGFGGPSFTPPASQLPPGLPSSTPQANVPESAPGVQMSQDEVSKVMRTVRDSFRSGTKLTESNLAELLVRRGLATKGPEAKAKAALVFDMLKGSK